MPKLFFLPGAGGSATFWRPVAERLDPDREKHFFSWPGLGNEPHDPRNPQRANIRGIDDLVAMVMAELDEPADLIAQSMGGLVAIRAALQAPDRVRRLVLTAASAGIPVADYGGSDWRPDYRREFPHAVSWITDPQDDISAQLRTIDIPTLLIWGGSDSISPPAVGHRLLDLLPRATLHIIEGGDHDLARTKTAEIVPLIAAHLGQAM